MSAVKYCRCAFTDPDGTVNPGAKCELHPVQLGRIEQAVRNGLASIAKNSNGEHVDNAVVVETIARAVMEAMS